MSEHERSLAAPAFPDDDGLVAPELAEALGQADDERDARVLAVYGGVRVYVPVVATLGSGGRTETGGDKDADMAAVLMTG
ncbi:MAG: SseB family protein, partial [Actinomycetales bacterium]